MAKSSDFGPKSDGSARRIIKSKNWICLSSGKNLAEQSLGYTAAAAEEAVRGKYRVNTGYIQGTYRVNTAVVRIAIGTLDYEYNHDKQTQSPRLSAYRRQLSGNTGSDLETDKSSASSARLSWPPII